MARRQYRTFVGDFETTVYEGQEDTEVWASAIVELFTEDVKIHNSINETFAYLVSLNTNIIIYYHNLKFDGAFWLDFLIIQLGFMQAFKSTGDKPLDLAPCPDYEMPNKSVKYSIGDMGQFYSITIRVKDKFIIIRDSLKLLPFSVRKIGKSFGTVHKKLEMEYEGFRFAGCEITEKEKKYIANDVLVVKEALEILLKEGHDKTTIGSCCLQEFKLGYDKEQWFSLFPDLRQNVIPKDIFGEENAEAYIRHAYKGGWCYVVKGKQEKHYMTTGTTADVNSLYPSMMTSESGNEYPVGNPVFWNGNFIPEEATKSHRYYFIRIKTRFNIKRNRLPCIQIKGSIFYKGTEWLETSKCEALKNKVGLEDRYDNQVTLTLTQTDYQLIQEQYNLYDFEILDGCWFYTSGNLFDEYIDKYRKIKMENKGAKRELAKLFLNNLYGKMATAPENWFKYVASTEDNIIHFVGVKGEDKTPVYIPIGAAITSYARNFTIRAAQANYYGVNKPGFIYADTDSIHCDLPSDKLKGIKVDANKFCHWKLEATWDEAIFTRQKTYIEHVVEENLEPCEPYYNVRCAGMPDNCKNLFEMSMGNVDINSDEFKKLNDEAKKFVLIKRTIEDFKVGLKVPGKLVPKRIRGGVVLKETTYEMR